MRVIILMVYLLCFCGLAGGAEFSVDRLDDAADVDTGDGLCLAAGGGCTLRAAVSQANALPGFDSIVLGPGVHVLSLPGRRDDANLSGDLDITAALEIVGAGMDVTAISGAGVDRVLDVHAGDINAPVALHDLSVRDGLITSGAGQNTAPGSGLMIRIQATVQLENVRVHDNLNAWAGAGGIEVLGNLLGRRVVLQDNEGHALVLQGAVTDLSECLIQGHNEAIRVEGFPDTPNSAHFDRCSFIDNGADNSQAAVIFVGGHIDDVIFSNSTFSGNTGSSVIFNDNFSRLHLRNCTLFDNHLVGGSAATVMDIHGPAAPMLHLSNTVAFNSVKSQQVVVSAANLITDGGNWLGAVLPILTWHPGDVVDAAVAPGLLPREHVNAFTALHRTTTDSELIDAGQSGPCTARDQLNRARPLDGDGDAMALCDIGAVEFAPEVIFADGFN